MRELVADHRANGAVVQRLVGLRVEERRLQDGRGEHDLVELRIVVGIDGLRCQPPFALVDGLADLAQLPAIVEGIGRGYVAVEAVPAGSEARPVAPLGGNPARWESRHNTG